MEHPLLPMLMAKHSPYDKCFLCGKTLDKKHIMRDKEHVFPRWLQSKYNLWNKKYPLGNGTEIPFRQLTIQCCYKCNNMHLCRIEDTIKQATDVGYDAFTKLDELVIYQWLAKIFYGMLFKKLTLLQDRKQPKKGFIASPELLKIFANIHDFLQSVRVPVKFDNFKPWSLFIVETAIKGDDSFGYTTAWDNGKALTIGMRMGTVGLIACLEDYSYNKSHLSSHVEELKGIKLQPIQFDELFTLITYKSHLDNRPSYLVMYIPNGEGFDVSLALDSDQELADKQYREWNTQEYAQLLYIYWQKYGLSFEDIYLAPDNVVSKLYNPDGTINCMS
jgi:hypothetical protein